jgi:signal transduction histidine kinase
VQTGQDTAELAPLVGSLNQLLGRMNRAIEHERRWTADAAHELRTPLTAIKTHVQVAQLVLERHAPPGPGSPGNPAGQALKQASEGIDHMHATLEQLLQLARVESASTGTPPSTEGTAITEALHLACRQSLQRAGKGGAPTPRLQTGLEPDALHGWELPLAPALLTCAVTNLVDNALRHHLGEQPITLQLSLQPAGTGTAGDTDGVDEGLDPAHGTTSHGTAGTTGVEACASTASAPATLQIQVRDHGPGLSAEECAQALQRFWRKTSATQGSGLGLTIVQRIAESAGGQLHLATGAPGLVATLSLPLQRGAHRAA